MTRVEALRSALSNAVRDGETELARALTQMVSEEINKYPSNAIRIHPVSRPRKSVPTLGRFDDSGKSKTRPG